MKIITIGTLKGGTGKTTISFNLGGVLAEKYRVLLIDVDPQCNLTAACGVDISRGTHKSSRDIFIDDIRKLSPESIVVTAPIQELPNLDIIASHTLLTAAEYFLVSRPAREWVLDSFIQRNKDFFSRYDYILIDTNPSMCIVNQNSFAVADSIVLISDISEDGIAGVELFMHLWENIHVSLRIPNRIKAMVINLADRRISLTEELREYCKDHEDLASLLVPTAVYSKVIYKDARIYHKPVNIINHGELAVRDIYSLAEDLFAREVF